MKREHQILIQQNWSTVAKKRKYHLILMNIFPFFGFGQGIPGQRKIKKIARTILQKHCEKDQLNVFFELSIALIDDKEMREINHQYRGKKQTTDVLSFPLFDFPVGPGTSALLTHPQKKEKILSKWPVQEEDYLLLGDIVISCPCCIRQARTKKYKKESFPQAIEKEFIQLLIHGILHLFGYDHETNHKDYLGMKRKGKELYSYF